MKKILFLTHVGEPGGAELNMIELCRSVMPAAEVAHFQEGSLAALLQEAGIPARICLMPEAMASFRREDGLGAMLKAIPAALSMLHRLAKMCREFDIIVCMSQKSFLLTAIAKLFIRRPIIWFMNDILSAEHFSRMTLLVATTASRLAADHVVLNSQASLEAWLASGGKKKDVSIIYPGPDVAAVDPQLQDKERIQARKAEFSPDNAPLIGIFGRISPWKGQDIFLRALSKLPQARGLIVGGALFGEEEYAQGIRNLTRELGIESRVHFAGHVKDVVQTMAACDVVAHCSTAPEPFGRVIVEAMLAGTPVIASDAGGAKEIIHHEETGLLTPIGDVDALVEAMAYYLANPELAAQMTLNARKTAERDFSAESSHQKFRQILDSL